MYRYYCEKFHVNHSWESKLLFYMYKIYFIFEFQIKFFSPSPSLTLFLYSHVAYVIWQISKVHLKS